MTEAEFITELESRYSRRLTNPETQDSTTEVTGVVWKSVLMLEENNGIADRVKVHYYVIDGGIEGSERVVEHKAKKKSTLQDVAAKDTLFAEELQAFLATRIGTNNIVKIAVLALNEQADFALVRPVIVTGSGAAREANNQQAYFVYKTNDSSPTIQFVKAADNFLA